MCLTESMPKTLVDLTNRFADPKVCRAYLAQLRWQGKPVCQHCKSDAKIYLLSDGNYKCGTCLKKFSVIKGTIFEDTKLPLSKWFVAVYLITAHKKGISSLQLGRDLGVTQKTAWYMLHRIRYALRAKTFDVPLTGVVELDETYVGGKSKNKHASKRPIQASGRSLKVKAPVFGLMQRGGRIVAMAVNDVSAHSLTPIVTKHVMLGASIMTDEWRAYARLSERYEHSVVRHGQGEYATGEPGAGRVHTNTIEGFWSLFKRGIVGIYHNVSVKHLNKYVGEFEYRYNTRKNTEGERFDLSLFQTQGRRLTYADLTQANTQRLAS